MNLIWIMPAEGEEVEIVNPYACGIRVFYSGDTILNYEFRGHDTLKVSCPRIIKYCVPGTQTKGV